MKMPFQMKLKQLMCLTLSLFTTYTYTASIRLHGHAQIARSTYSLKSTVTGSLHQAAGFIDEADDDANRRIVDQIIFRLLSQQPLSQSNPDIILQGPGAITVDSKDNFKLEVAGHPDKTPKSIKGSQIKFLAEDSVTNTEITNIGDGKTALIAKTDGTGITEASINLEANKNTLLRSTGDSIVPNYVPSLIPNPNPGDNLDTPTGAGVDSAGVIKFKLVSPAQADLFFKAVKIDDAAVTHSTKFFSLVESEDNKDFFLMRANPNNNNVPLAVIKDTTIQGADNFDEHTTLDYLSVIFTGGVDFNINPMATIATSISLEAPIESIDQEGEYLAVFPEISAMFDVGIKAGGQNNTFGVFIGKKFTRYTTKVLTFNNAQSPFITAVRSDDELMSHNFISIKADITMTPFMQGHIEYQHSQEDTDLSLPGATNSIIQGHRLSAGIATTVIL
jgi:hypothetical protein